MPKSMLAAIAEALSDGAWLTADEIADRLDDALGTDADAVTGRRTFAALCAAGLVERDRCDRPPVYRASQVAK